MRLPAGQGQSRVPCGSPPRRDGLDLHGQQLKTLVDAVDSAQNNFLLRDEIADFGCRRGSGLFEKREEFQSAQLYFELANGDISFVRFSLGNIRRLEKEIPASSSDPGTLINASDGKRADYAVQSYRWLRRAAEQGLPDAQAILAGLYGDGLGVEKDPGVSFVWVTLALGAPPEEWAMGKKARANFVELRKNIATLMTDSQLSEAARVVQQWKSRRECEDCATWLMVKKP